jgi:hypothetical protein
MMTTEFWLRGNIDGAHFHKIISQNVYRSFLWSIIAMEFECGEVTMELKPALLTVAFLRYASTVVPIINGLCFLTFH